MAKHEIMIALSLLRASTSKSEKDHAERKLLDAIDDAFLDDTPIEKDILRLRQKYAPSILAALIARPHPGNDDAMLAHTVSLSHKLAVLVLTR